MNTLNGDINLIQAVLGIEAINTLDEPKSTSYDVKESVRRFVASVPTNRIIGVPIKEVQEDYFQFCIDNNLVSITGNRFSRQLRKDYNIITKSVHLDGTTENKRVYVLGGK